MKGALRDGMKSRVWRSEWDKVEYHFIPDASGAGNLGFLAGGAWVQDEQRGTVLELNGRNDRVEINNSPDLNTGNAYRKRTVAFWFRAAKSGDKKREPRQVLYEEGGSGSGINLYLDGDVLYAGTWLQGKGTWLHSKGLDREAWHHTALVLRAGEKDAEAQIELYLDGHKIAESEAPVMGSHPGDINLGRCGNTLFPNGKAVEQPGQYFAGRIDDFRIANRSFTEEEIGALAKKR